MYANGLKIKVCISMYVCMSIYVLSTLRNAFDLKLMYVCITTFITMSICENNCLFVIANAQYQRTV